MNKHLNVRDKNYKILRRNIGINFQYLWFFNGFLNMTIKVYGKQRINRYIRLKIKSFCIFKDIIEKVRISSSEPDTIMEDHVSDIWLVSYTQYMNNSYNSIIKRPVDQFKNW